VAALFDERWIPGVGEEDKTSGSATAGQATVRVKKRYA
jgi:hypothetical protein